MTEEEIGAYYQRLNAGEKGRFTAYACLRLGGSPNSWQKKFLVWSKGMPRRQSLRPVLTELTMMIGTNCWKA